MPPPKKKGGKGKQKGKKQPNRQQRHNQQHNKPAQHNQNKQKNTQQPKKQKLTPEETAKRCDSILESMHEKFTQTHPKFRTFFGIFTKHNLKQIRVLLNYSDSEISKNISDKFLDSLNEFNDRDINLTIFQGDIMIGAVGCSVNKQTIHIEFVAILPRYRNYGFGSRLLIQLMKGALKRPKLNEMTIRASPQNEKLMSFLQRFGFAPAKADDDESKVESTEDSNNALLAVDLRQTRRTLLYLLRKELKESESKPNNPNANSNPKNNIQSSPNKHSKK